MYKPGTLITLKDGNVYRTSKRTICACDRCIAFYIFHGKHRPCSTYNIPNPFDRHPQIIPSIAKYKNRCVKMYGEYQFPKLVTLCTNQDR